MLRNHAKIISILFLIALTGFYCTGNESHDRQSIPNFIFILSDDQGWNDIGYHGSEILTPNLDRLALQGIRFNQHYVHPVCSPTRAALMTGRFPSRFGILGPIAGDSKQILPTSVETLPQILARIGYETHISGKWHLALSTDFGPTKYGFKTSYGYLHGQIDPYTHRYKFGDRTWHRNDSLIEEEGHVTDLITDDAIRYVVENRDRPFFLLITYSVPHYPLAEPPEWVEMYESIVTEGSRGLFAASISHMDSGIGRIIEALEDIGISGNTVIIFSSDNGGQESWLNNENQYEGRYPPDPVLGNNLPFKGWKGSVYEGGTRVPAFAYWPGTLKPGILDQPVHIVDWLPTLVGLTKEKSFLPNGLDGQDISSLLFDPTRLMDHKPIYIKASTGSSLRLGDWKIIELPNDKIELYNIRNDPGETDNVAKTETGRCQKLLSILKDIQGRDSSTVERN